MAGCAGLNAINPFCQGGQLLGGAAKSVGTSIFDSIAHDFANVASSAVKWLWNQLNTSTSLDLGAPEIHTDLVATGAIAGLVAFALFLMQVIGSVLRQEPGGLGRALRGLGVAFIGAAVAVATTQVVLAAVDALSSGVVQFALGTNTQGMGSRLISANTLTSIGNPAGLLLVSLVLIAAVVVVWVAMMIRKMLIIISAVFAPVAFAGATNDVSRAWVRRWIEFTAALIFSKLILVIIFMIGLSVLQGGNQTSAGNNAATSTSITNFVIGALTLLLAGFAPWIAMKMVHFAGDAVHAVHGQAGMAVAGGRTAVGAPQKIAAMAGPFAFGGTAAAASASAGKNGFNGSGSAGSGGRGGQPGPSGGPSRGGSSAPASGAVLANSVQRVGAHADPGRADQRTPESAASRAGLPPADGGAPKQATPQPQKVQS